MDKLVTELEEGDLPQEPQTELSNSEGSFLDSLKRNNKQIREDRALAIGEEAEITYRRSIEDLKLKLKRLHRARLNMLDMSPSNALSLKLAEEFDADQFVEKDLELGIEIRNLTIKLDIGVIQYQKLFGKTI